MDLTDLELEVLDLLYRMGEVKRKSLPCQSAGRALINKGLVGVGTGNKYFLTGTGISYVEANLRKDSLRN